MSIIVQKFGGTSVATAERITAAAQRAVAAKRAGHQVVMVVSARGKKTDELVDLAAQITESPRAREMDMLLSTGEQESVALVAMAIHMLGEQAVSMTGGQIGIVTDSTFSKARIRSISTTAIQKQLDAGKIVVACGFQGVDDEGNITTLGRGGSDTTATALAAALRAEECEIYTDVEGVFSTDPRAVPEARKIQQISYDEMLELASVGAGVMHSRSIEFAKKFNVPLRVRPSFSDGVGTLIAAAGGDESRVVTGMALVKNEARVTLLDLPDRPGVMSTVFARMAAHKIPIDMVVQNVAVAGKAEVSFTVPSGDLAETLTAAEEAIKELGAGKIQSGTHVAKVSAVGNGMRTHSGVAAQMFQIIANLGANIEMITTSEIKISALVDRKLADETLKELHQGFHLEAPRASVPPVGVRQTGDGGWDTEAHDALLRDVVSRLSSMEDIVVSEVLLDDAQSRVTIHNLPDVPGTCAQLFTAVAEGDVMVDMIVQNVSHDGSAEVSFTVNRSDLDRCLLLTREVLEAWDGAQLTSERDIAKLTVVGIGLRTHTGVGEKMFRALAEANINIQMINTSEIRMSAVVQANQGPAGLQALQQTFGLQSDRA
ncbi:MAG: aspartate kinase [Planctomycetaceae bacterium]|nr:aspartate kinase [Planctomycetaceae bacterium]